MTELRWNSDFKSSINLDRPVLAVAFKGLFDASGAATSALEWLSSYFSFMKLGEIDPETFFDFTQERPTVLFGENGERELRWPANEINAIKTPVPRSGWETTKMAGISISIIGIRTQKGFDMRSGFNQL
mgnify:CR=1 FL=1